MKSLKKRQKEEGVFRMESIVNKYNLNPNLIEYLKEDRLYYSHITGSGFIGSIDTITYDPKYLEIVNNFEKERLKAHVYHAIESDTVLGNDHFKFLSLLFVSRYEDEWDTERIQPSEDYVQAYIFNITAPEWSEIGEIYLDSFHEIGDYAVLIRKG